MHLITPTSATAVFIFQPEASSAMFEIQGSGTGSSIQSQAMGDCGAWGTRRQGGDTWPTDARSKLRNRNRRFRKQELMMISDF